MIRAAWFEEQPDLDPERRSSSTSAVSRPRWYACMAVQFEANAVGRLGSSRNSLSGE